MIWEPGKNVIIFAADWGFCIADMNCCYYILLHAKNHYSTQLSENICVSSVSPFLSLMSLKFWSNVYFRCILCADTSA